MFNDVSRAFFDAPIQRDLCIKILDEDKNDEDKGRDMIGHMNESLYSA